MSTARVLLQPTVIDNVHSIHHHQQFHQHHTQHQPSLEQDVLETTRLAHIAHHHCHQQQQQQQKHQAVLAPPQPGLSIPTLPSEDLYLASKPDFVESLVCTAASLVESIWPPRATAHSVTANASNSPKLAPLSRVIQELLRRSRTSCSTLQLALFYLIRLRNSIISRRTLPADSPLIPPATSPLRCGRRMFLSALILANKYLQDKNYSNKAWAKICGLTASELCKNEATFLEAVEWNLFVANKTWINWSRAVHRRAATVREQWNKERQLMEEREKRSKEVVGRWLESLEGKCSHMDQTSVLGRDIFCRLDHEEKDTLRPSHTNISTTTASTNAPTATFLLTPPQETWTCSPVAVSLKRGLTPDFLPSPGAEEGHLSKRVRR
ncbi:uncharacterized protein SPPG_00888 [Spizellomyces punctatus DAOM BR117]|uniref:Cyclin N-terminal domain-containing protein n=1 Tax=Spizellomyces punctatus (strain DAOM BR117) TaxID=645134 RepID=A0A0L0HR36_SPIPD|nr:uncharacterized protein SPPG_00888 [Spizellomyces punctatus DAOM BR117]KND03400.1 hypothetical protein SPPG_00888 [Spizellomyces punctatus DAOM BR117]|eukprot:XP_016611439.1 hypothetical protein SPPG_00888 [Spizellomyces punctatus DAOM BR117]